MLDQHAAKAQYKGPGIVEGAAYGKGQPHGQCCAQNGTQGKTLAVILPIAGNGDKQQGDGHRPFGQRAASPYAEGRGLRIGIEQQKKVLVQGIHDGAGQKIVLKECIRLCQLADVTASPACRLTATGCTMVQNRKGLRKFSLTP